MHAAGVSPTRVLAAGLGIVVVLTACGTPPPDAASLLRQSSKRMTELKGFHFRMQISGFTGTGEPVQSAEGDAHPPDLRAKVNLREGSLLLEVEVIFAGDAIYLKGFTGGWQRLTAEQVAEFFDARTLFDPKSGLFAAMNDTGTPRRGDSEKVNGRETYPVNGEVSAARAHTLLTLIRDQGRYRVTYWIDATSNDLERARLTGNLFDPTHDAAITFDFSKHDQPVSVSPPPLG